MRLPLSSRKTILAVLGLIALDFVILWGRALLYIYAQVTDYKVDVLFVLTLVVLNIVLSPVLPSLCKKKKKLRWIAGGLAFIGVFLGGIYSIRFSENVPAWLLSFRVLIHNLLGQVFYITSIRADIVRLAFSYFFFSSISLLFSILFKNAFYDKRKYQVLLKNVDKTRVAIRWRGSRVVMGVERTLLLILVLISVTVGVAAIANESKARSTYIETRTFTGPDTPCSVSTLLVDSRTGTLFAGTMGLYSLQSGDSVWEVSSGGLPNNPVISLLQDQDGTLFAGIYDITGSPLYRSRDGGATWEASSEGLTGISVSSLLQARDGMLFAATDGGVYRSRDGGATWEASNAGLTSIEVHFIFQDRDGMLFAGTYGGGVYRSRDGGTTWDASSAGLSSTGVSSLLQDQDGTLFAGTNSGVYRSWDGGTTWEAFNAGLTSSDVYSLLQDHDGTLFAGTGTGVYHSSDGGASWAISGLTDLNVYSILQDQDGTLFAGTNGGVYRSRDGGATWEASNAGLTSIEVHFIFQDRDGMLFAGTYGGGVYRSRDGGTTWDASSAGLSSTGVSSLLQDQDGTLFAGTYDDGVYRSRDGGAAWEASSAGLLSTSVRSLIQDRDGTLFAGTNGGVYRSRDGGTTWEASSADLTSSDVYSLFQDQDGTLFAGISELGDCSLYRSRNGGESWEKTSLYYLQVLSLIQDRDGTLFAGTNGGVYRSRDGGVTWEASSEGLTGISVSSLLQARDGMLFAGTYSDGVYRSRDGGTTWEVFSAGLTNIEVHFIFQARDSMLFAGTYGGGVYRSRDGGTTWEASSAGLSSTAVSSLFQDRDNTLLAGTVGGGVYRSQDGGITWEASSLINTIVYYFLQDRDGTLFAGADSGVYRSRDGGTTWEAFNAGLISSDVYSLLQDQDGTLFAGTGNGVYRLSDGFASWESSSRGLPLSGSSHTSVYYLLQTQDGTLFAGTLYGIYCSRDGGINWTESISRPVIYPLSSWVSVSDSIFQTDKNLLFAKILNNSFRSRNNGETWIKINPDIYYLSYADIPEWALYESVRGNKPAWFFDNLTMSVLQFKKAGVEQKHYFAWGATILEITSQPADAGISGFFWPFRTWTEFWFKPRWGYFAGSFAFLFLLLGIIPYGRAAWVLKLQFFQPSQASSILQNYLNKNLAPNLLERWQDHVQNELLTFGDISPNDLVVIPVLLRQPMLEAYLRHYERDLALQRRGKKLTLLAGNALKTWQAAWTRVGEDFSNQAGLSSIGKNQVAELAKVLCGVLGFSLGEYYETESSFAWQVEAPALRLNLPQRFPLIFLANPNPSPETVRVLFDAISVLKETSNFTLVVPLEPEAPEVDIPQVLRRVIDASPYAHDFVVLSKQDVLDILIARRPDRVLVGQISRQVDLSFISPFIVNGPVPPQMFFGRDREIRNLVDHAGKRNFAVVGNRKIGKTSLLNRVESRVSLQGDIHLIRLDCQSIRDSADFYVSMEAALGTQLNSHTPFALAAALHMAKESSALPLVIMLDEVDALLAAERSQGEPLLSSLRKLAFEHTCSFIFCGGKVLARQLRDKESALFNFPEMLPLPYLARTEMDDVIIRPLETLGIKMQESHSILDAVWDLTSGHPNLTQWLGRKLVNAANERRDRVVNRDDVVKLWTDSDFIQFYFDTVWGAASPLEKLITLLTSDSNFGVGDVERVLSGAGAKVSDAQVDAALEMLLVYSILGRTGKAYHFVPQAFHKLLELNYEKERLVKRELEKLAGGIE